MTDFDRSLAIIIGIDRYQGGISKLQTAVSDAIAVAELLRQNHDYDVTLLLDADATQERLTILLDQTLPQTVRGGDRDL
jgi:Caspase domain